MNAPVPASQLLPLGSQPSEWPEQLRKIHAELDLALSAMDAASEGASPDRGNYSTSRWKLSVASRNRRSLVGRICQCLGPLASPEDKIILDRLYQDDMQMLRHSVAHVGEWTLDAIQQNWVGYREASRKVRATMTARIEEEKRLLYPLLRKYTQIG